MHASSQGCPLSLHRAHLECWSNEAIVWPHAPFLCPGDAMINNISAEHTKTQQKTELKNKIQLQNFLITPNEKDATTSRPSGE